MIIILGSTKCAKGTIRQGDKVYDAEKRSLGIVRNIYKYDLSGVLVNVLNDNGVMMKYKADQLYKG